MIHVVSSGLESQVYSLLAGDIHVRTIHFSHVTYKGYKCASSASCGVRLEHAQMRYTCCRAFC